MRMTVTIMMALSLTAVLALAQEAEAPAGGVQEAVDAGPAAVGERVQDDLVVLYRFNNVVEETLVPDLTEELGGLDLVIAGAEIRDDGVHFPLDSEARSIGLFSTEAATAVIEAAGASGQITIEAWITPASADLTGPARIVSISRGTGERNFTLGQERDAYALRLRTSATDQQGMPQLSSGEGTLRPGELQHVVVTYDGAVTMIYLDGELLLDSFGRTGSLDNWDEAMLLAVGNETTGDRRWAGSVHLVAIYSMALSPEQVRQNCEAGL